MTGAGGWPGRVCVAGLAGLSAVLLIAPPAGTSAPPGVRLLVGSAAALPLLLLLAARLRSPARWGTWVALVMIPYVALSVGSWLVSPSARGPGIAFALTASVVFFCGLFAGRAPHGR